MSSPAVTSSQEFTSGSGTFTGPDGVSVLFVTMIGGGGAGRAKISGAVGSGGGSAEYCVRVPLHITPGSPGPTFAYSVGALGAGTTGNGGDGGATTFGPFTVMGGFGCGASNVPGNGGGPGGGVGTGTLVTGAPGAYEGNGFSGGAAGGQGGNGVNGMQGGPAVGYLGGAGGTVSTGGGGGGGGSSPWGAGGAGGNGSAGAANPGGDATSTSYGAAGGGTGGGTGSPTGGDGAGGYILIEWIREP